MANKNQDPKKLPKGQVDAADDLLLDMENSPPDLTDMVFRINPDGSVTKFPASELPESEW